MFELRGAGWLTHCCVTFPSVCTDRRETSKGYLTHDNESPIVAMEARRESVQNTNEAQVGFIMEEELFLRNNLGEKMSLAVRSAAPCCELSSFQTDNYNRRSQVLFILLFNAHVEASRVRSSTFQSADASAERQMIVESDDFNKLLSSTFAPSGFISSCMSHFFLFTSLSTN